MFVSPASTVVRLRRFFSASSFPRRSCSLHLLLLFFFVRLSLLVAEYGVLRTAATPRHVRSCHGLGCFRLVPLRQALSILSQRGSLPPLAKSGFTSSTTPSRLHAFVLLTRCAGILLETALDLSPNPLLFSSLSPLPSSFSSSFSSLSSFLSLFRPPLLPLPAITRLERASLLSPPLLSSPLLSSLLFLLPLLSPRSLFSLVRILPPCPVLLSWKASTPWPCLTWPVPCR